MTNPAAAERYLRKILAASAPSPSEVAVVRRAAAELIPFLKGWASEYLAGISWSGSFAKNTAVRGNTDVDLFVSLHARTPAALKDIYNHLATCLDLRGYRTQARNVSIRVWPKGVPTDLVVGRRQGLVRLDHSLYSRRQDTWLKTNVTEHVRLVRESPHRDVVRLVKMWRMCHGLEWPSFYLEMSTLHALKGLRPSPLAHRLAIALADFAEHLPETRILDPANSNNVVSDELTRAEKAAIATAARGSLQQAYWEEIVW